MSRFDPYALLQVAIDQARQGLAEGGLPIGAALFRRDGTLLGCGRNRRIQDNDPSLHAETDAFRKAGRRPSYRETVLVTTLAPGPNEFKIWRFRAVRGRATLLAETKLEEPMPAPAATLEHPEVLAGAPPSPPPPQPGAARLASLDAYRGFIMIILAANGFGWRHLADHPGYAWIARQFDHVPWTGMVFWDLIQPAFMFMVGVAMPFSVARRLEQGATHGQIFRHVLWRSFLLIVLSQALMSVSANRLHFQLINVLSQIAFTYLLSYLIFLMPFRWQAVCCAGILAAHTALFYLFPGPDGAFSQAGNIGARIDHFFGLHYRGYYVTINFITETATTLFGVWTGVLMRRRDTHAHRMKVLAGAAAACFALGWALTPIAPMVKRIWTASFTFASAGWVLLMLLFFYWAVDVRGWRKPAFPLIVVGMNSIFIYSISIILAGWLDRAVGVFTFRWQFIGTLAPVAQATTVVLVMWYLCYWLYQRRIFFKL